MSLGFCPVCLVCDHATDESKDSMLRYQAVKLDQMRAELLPLQVALGKARDRERELLETIDRLNRKVQAAERKRSA